MHMKMGIHRQPIGRGHWAFLDSRLRGIHRQPIGRGHWAFLDSRLRGNDGGIFFLRKRLRDLQENKIPIFWRGGWRSQPPLQKM